MKNVKIKRAVLVYSHKAVESDRNVLFKVKNILMDEDVSFTSILIDKFDDSYLKDVDLVLVVGGDGTFIRVSHFLENELILGINSDSKTSEGGLLVLNEFNLERLKKILNGKFSILERKRIDVFLNGDLLSSRALNEVYFGAQNQFHTSRYILNVDGKKEEQRSSGVLVVTCTGSRAWYKSAGGRSFFRRGILKYLVRELFVSRVFNSKLRRGKVRSFVEFVSRMHHEAVVAMDSNFIVPVKFDDDVRIEMSKVPLKCVKL